MFHVLFKPEEVKATLRALKGLRPLFQQYKPAVDTLFYEVRSRAVESRTKIIARVRHQGLDPRDVALRMIFDRAFDAAAESPTPLRRVMMQSVCGVAGDAMVVSGHIDETQNEAKKKSLQLLCAF